MGRAWPQAEVAGSRDEGWQETRRLSDCWIGEGFGSQEGPEEAQSLKLAPGIKRQGKGRSRT
jgi:hypothetical protein